MVGEVWYLVGNVVYQIGSSPPNITKDTILSQIEEDKDYRDIIAVYISKP